MSQKFSKRGFVLASIGAAVGLGNALRFPGLCARYGGGAFLLIYIAALVVLGVPLLNAEIALGRRAGGGAPKSMAYLIRGGEKFGWPQCVNSLFTALIYAGLAGWILAEGVSVFGLCMGGAGQGEAFGHFFGEVLKSGGDGVISGISPIVALASAAVWVAEYFCLRGGADTLSKAARFTVFIPIVLLAFLAVRGLFTESAGRALSALFVPAASQFANPEVWITALGQVFFSLSLAVGIMPVYGSYLPEKTDIFPSSLVIAGADALVSVLASVALFTTLYGCGMEDKISDSGIITAFCVYPSAIVGLFESPAACAVFGTVFYVSLAMMAVQSGVSMLEAFLSPLIAEFSLPRKKAALAVCVTGGLTGILYATTAADVIVGVGDRFVNFYNVLILCIGECLIMGFSERGRTLSSEVNRYCGRLHMPEKFFKISIGFLCPVTLALFTVPGLKGLFPSPPGWAELAFGWFPALVAAFSGVALSAVRRPIKGYKDLSIDNRGVK